MNSREEDDRLVELVERRLLGRPPHERPEIQEQLRKSGIAVASHVFGRRLLRREVAFDRADLENIRRRFEEEASSILEAPWKVKVIPPSVVGTSRDFILELHPEDTEITDVLQINLTLTF